MIPPASLLLLLILLVFLSRDTLAPDPQHFEGFGPEEDDFFEEELEPINFQSTHLPLTRTQPTPTPDSPNPTEPTPIPTRPDEEETNPSSPTTPLTTPFDFWDEDEFEGLPLTPPPIKPTQQPEPTQTQSPDPSTTQNTTSQPHQMSPSRQNYTVEIACVSFLIAFVINYFTGKRENENLALTWAAKFATKDSIFDKNFSLLGVGHGEDSPLLLKEGQNVFKFYASGRRYCQGLLATMELKNRHDLISRIYGMVVLSRDEIVFEVYMNDESMDHVVFALARKKLARVMMKEERDLVRYAGVVSQPPGGRKWVADELTVVSESKEVAGDFINDVVLDQVFGEKAFEKYGKGFISMHFSDQHPGTHKKVLLFKFALPDAKNMADMTRLVALIPHYIDLIGRYKLSSQARSKTEAARVKAAQEAYKEQQSARQEALQKKKAERKKMLEESEAKLSAEAIRKKEAKERARQMRKGMPKIKVSRA